ncbi:MarR family winged helix-turn-helix transcriptional regulator [Xylophilus ampelinus]|uniref:MarR family transcriptional regulator n=1 Tax=Xylophilus ampelinus TaxID=54067 RepID=A0A318SZR5_9BURK|nr:MarR family transcriptional regulator [Xylophilus ampelinus]PYE78618.1 MarR family transcriptional regulator [Xylophilus ampelinus]
MARNSPVNATKLQLVPVLDDERIGHEARAVADDHIDLKIWLRLLACSTQIEQQIRQHLRARFATTLPRFDYLAQLERHPDGLRMNALSRYLMVTGGNITGLTDQLEKEGLVTRVDDPEDRRSWRVALTPKGRTEFAAMAAEHETWLTAMFRGLGTGDKDLLYGQLGRLRVHLAQHQADLAAEPAAAPTTATAATAAKKKTASSRRRPAP